MRSTLTGLLCYCRPGFEPELAAELQGHARRAGFAVWVRAEPFSGLVELLGQPSDVLGGSLRLRNLIFARQKLELIAALDALDATDRIKPIIAALPPEDHFGRLIVEHADSEAAKPLAGLARAFANPLRRALRRSSHLAEKEHDDRDWLHVCLRSGTALLLARSQPTERSVWPGGVTRLRMHAGAPSRSALKLEEAMLTLLDESERSRWLRPGMRAVDLGAAPGGWSWLLARWQLRVTAIDNGPLQKSLLETGLVEHLRADGFRYLPRAPVDWLVCDMVESPRRITERIALWLREGHCRRALFNLKLPMKKRWDETQLCLDLLRESVAVELDVRARQLYHDREEITVFASLF